MSDAYGTALWVIDFLFGNAQYGSSVANFRGRVKALIPFVW